MTCTADQLIAACVKHIGYYRRPGTRTMFGEWYGLPTGQWCAIFLSYAANEVGALDIFPRHAYTPSGVNWFKARGQFHSGTRGIRRGDIPYFDFPGLPNRVSHVAIVESVNSDGSVNTIEGNTSGPTGDQRNGGACMRKRRASSIVGYGRPAYSNVAQPARDWLQKGDQGAEVRDLQQRLIAAGFHLGAHGADGVFGQDTEAALKRFQKAHNLEIDGVYGAKSKAVLTGTAQVSKPVKPDNGSRPAPGFPLPRGWYFGWKNGPTESVSGFYGYRAQLKQWQQRMRDRGWPITPDGYYGEQTNRVAKEFQAEKGLTPDGAIGPATWAAAWTAPIT